MKGSAWKLFVLALVVMIVAAALVVPVVAGAVARVAVMAPPRLSVRAGIRAVALRLPPCVRAGTRAVGDRSRSGRCRVRTPCVRAGRLAAAESVGPVASSGHLGRGMIKTGSKQRRVT